MPRQWYVQLMGEEIGPLGDDGLHRMVAQRRLTPDDLIRKAESSNWVSAGRVRGLFEQVAVTRTIAPEPMTPAPLPPTIATIVRNPPEPVPNTVNWAAAEKYCQNCGSVVGPKSRIKGTFAMELVLWLIFIPAGLAYTIWRLTTKEGVCPKCGASNLIPLDSPKARASLNLKS